MRRAIAVLLAAILWTTTSAAQFDYFSSVPSPYTMYTGFGELTDGVQGNADPGARIKQTVTLNSTTAVIITIGQSNAEPAATGTYSTTQATNYNYSIYDGNFYPCINPVVGAVYSPAQGSNSINCQIGDSLIGAGTYTKVVVIPTAVGGTLCSDWVSGVLQRRVAVLLRRLTDAKMTAGTGFTGDVWILLHQGESDNTALTPRATLAACYRSWASTLAATTGAARFFVPTESFINGTTSALVTGAQADAVASGCTTCRAGANWDTLTGANRQADATHFTQAGAAAAAALDVTIITNCKNTSC